MGECPGKTYPDFDSSNELTRNKPLFLQNEVMICFNAQFSKELDKLIVIVKLHFIRIKIFGKVTIWTQTVSWNHFFVSAQK